MLFLVSKINLAQTVVIDPGHGYYADCNNGDGRTRTEINTAYDVSIRLKNLITAGSPSWTVFQTRPTNACGSWISVTQRALMANNWDADIFLSIHCNAGGGTGTETFWCNQAATPDPEDQAYAAEVQTKMTSYAAWNWRALTEDFPYLAFHLGVLKTLNMHGCLNEIGFVDTQDSVKLLDNTWRQIFAQAYYNALANVISSDGPDDGLICTTATPISCGTRFSGQASLDTSSVTIYGCNNWTETGPERVHSITLDSAGSIAATISGFTGDLDVFILSSCDAASCVGAVSSSSALYQNAPAGTYYIVVDADDGSSGAYNLVVNCENKADLKTANLITPTTNYAPGDFFSLTHTIGNIGGANAGAFLIHYYLSEDSLLDAQDTLIGFKNVPSLNAVGTYTYTGGIPLPTNLNSVGAHYILSQLDFLHTISEIDEGNNYDILPLTITSITGIRAQNYMTGVSVYPNPAQNTLYLKTEQVLSPQSVVVFDLQGRSLELNLKRDGSIYSLDITGYSPGVYVLQLTTGQERRQFKFVKSAE